MHTFSYPTCRTCFPTSEPPSGSPIIPRSYMLPCSPERKPQERYAFDNVIVPFVAFNDDVPCAYPVSPHLAMAINIELTLVWTRATLPNLTLKQFERFVEPSSEIKKWGRKGSENNSNFIQALRDGPRLGHSATHQSVFHLMKLQICSILSWLTNQQMERGSEADLSTRSRRENKHVAFESRFGHDAGIS